MRSGHQLLEEVNLHPWVITDSAVGRGTNGRHLLGFGSALGSPIPPTLEPGLPRTLWHFLDRGVDGRFPSILKATIPSLNNPARVVLIHDGTVRPKGLFPNLSPTILVYALSYKLQDQWVKRWLML